MRVVVTGAGGQLAAAVAQACAADHQVIGFARADLDVGDDAAVAAAMDRTRPELIVNGAALTNVDLAEERPLEALRVNAFGPRALARAARKHGAVLVHYSTDFVFDGAATQPYVETDRPNPLGTYAASKLLGEWFALDAPRAYVLRVESLFGRAPGGPPEKGSVATIVRGLLAGDSPKVFADRTISPTYIPDAARATLQLVADHAAAGVYHCVNSGHTTWFEFARELARQLGVPPTLTPVRMAEMTLKARRPLYCALSNAKLRAAGVPMSPWQDALARFVSASCGVQSQPRR
jgi:dTDP-4-dehydrorhamnose reductase